MPRDIPVGNGKLLVCFDKQYQIRDLYFPHVGQENHVSGDVFRCGIWADGIFSWVGPGWQIELKYLEDTNVTDVTLYNEKLGILLQCKDTVDFHEDIYLRKISIENLHSRTREIKLFFTQSFNISGNNVGDTAAFDPKSGGIVHYKGARYFLANGCTEEGKFIDQFATGQKNSSGKVGTYKDAEDGFLSGNPISQGSVDSVLGLTLDMPKTSRKTLYYWLAVGENWNSVRHLDTLVKQKNPESFIKRTAAYWQLWAKKETPPLEQLPKEIAALYRRSLLVLNTQIDSKGGILAANDSDVIQFNRDTYSYIWPRDGALVANALDVAGYPVIAQRFYDFASRVIEREGYFLHKFNPDGTLASSWHPWPTDDEKSLPIQEDETALVIWALWQHFVKYRDIEFIKPLYRPLIKNAGDFMCRYRDEETGLPNPSYDLWEERRGMLSYTTGTVFGGLTAASLFCKVFGENDRADKYQKAASEIRDAASRHLWQEKRNRFCRMLYRNEKGSLEADNNHDASLWGLFAFGLYNVDDPRIISTIKSLRKHLWLDNEIGGMARYENDPYYKSDNGFPGNPWFICTLWLADYYTELAQNERDLRESITLLEWVAKHSLPSGVLAEQVDPKTGEPLSVSPLTWSHATFVASTQRILFKMARMKACKECGHSIMDRVPGEDWLSQLYNSACDTIHRICSVK